MFFQKKLLTTDIICDIIKTQEIIAGKNFLARQKERNRIPMKKLIASILIIASLVSLFSVSASAATITIDYKNGTGGIENKEVNLSKNYELFETDPKHPIVTGKYAVGASSSARASASTKVSVANDECGQTVTYITGVDGVESVATSMSYYKGEVDKDGDPVLIGGYVYGANCAGAVNSGNAYSNQMYAIKIMHVAHRKINGQHTEWDIRVGYKT